MGIDLKIILHFTTPELSVQKKKPLPILGRGFSNLLEYGEYAISLARFIDSYTYILKYNVVME
jgi:hypothetical protein